MNAAEAVPAGSTSEVPSLDDINALESELYNEVQHHREVTDGQSSIGTELQARLQAEMEARKLVQQLMANLEERRADHLEVEKQLDKAIADSVKNHERIRNLEEVDSKTLKALEIEASKIKADRQRLKVMREAADVEVEALEAGSLYMDPM